jgi:KDO2-lipid IV(A) lauroyltransferase
MKRAPQRLESSREGVSRLTWFLRGVRRRAAYYALLVTRAALQALPERLAHALFRFLADLASITAGAHRRRALENLRIAFPGMRDSEARLIVKRMLRHLARNAVEFIRFPLYSKQRILSMVTIEHSEIVARLSRQGKGAIAMSAHLGNWELVAAAVAAMGYKISVVARRIYYDKFEHLLQGTRRAAGVRVVHRDEPKEILRALRDGHFLGILPDMDIAKLDSVYVEFFGRLALTPTGPVALALRTGVPLFAAFIVRNADGRHTVHVEEPIELIRTGDMQKDLLLNTIRATKRIEAAIRQYPDQWMWIHRRWQHQPEWEFLKESHAQAPSAQRDMQP